MPAGPRPVAKLTATSNEYRIEQRARDRNRDDGSPPAAPGLDDCCWANPIVRRAATVTMLCRRNARAAEGEAGRIAIVRLRRTTRLVLLSEHATTRN
jgi:hypothetical protein